MDLLKVTNNIVLSTPLPGINRTTSNTLVEQISEVPYSSYDSGMMTIPALTDPFEFLFLVHYVMVVSLPVLQADGITYATNPFRIQKGHMGDILDTRIFTFWGEPDIYLIGNSGDYPVQVKYVTINTEAFVPPTPGS